MLADGVSGRLRGAVTRPGGTLTAPSVPGAESGPVSRDAGRELGERGSSSRIGEMGGAGARGMERRLSRG